MLKEQTIHCYSQLISDLRKLERDFPEVKTQKMIDQCVDLGVYCNDVMGTGGRWSMANLVSHIVSFCLVFLCFCSDTIRNEFLSVLVQFTNKQGSKGANESVARETAHGRTTNLCSN